MVQLAQNRQSRKSTKLSVTVVENYLLLVHIECDNFCYCLGCAIVCIKVHSSRINRDLMKMCDYTLRVVILKRTIIRTIVLRESRRLTVHA